jgi:hypothetical protein
MTGVIMIVLIFLVGSLLGALLGALVCIRFVRQEVTGDLGPKLRQIQGQLNTIEAELTYMVSARYAELNAQMAHDPRRRDL